MQRQGIKPTMTEGQIRMADDTHTATRSYVQAPLRLQGRTYTHTFAILPSLREDMLIGVDLWCQLGLNIAPPRRKIRQRQYPACGMTGGLATRTTEEGEQLLSGETNYPIAAGATITATKANTDQGPKTGRHTRPLHVLRNPGPHGPRTATADHGGTGAGTDRPRPTLRGSRIVAV
ncbi:hypothetical protein ACFW04_012582 [Cataglyphis niger]